MTQKLTKIGVKNDRMSHFKITARNKNIIGTHFVNSVVCVDKNDTA
jgi:hypothetical protein